jgi:hypothetical protein
MKAVAGTESVDAGRKAGVTDIDVLEATDYCKTARGQQPNGATSQLISAPPRRTSTSWWPKAGRTATCTTSRSRSRSDGEGRAVLQGQPLKRAA